MSYLQLYYFIDIPKYRFTYLPTLYLPTYVGNNKSGNSIVCLVCFIISYFLIYSVLTVQYIRQAKKPLNKKKIMNVILFIMFMVFRNCVVPYQNRYGHALCCPSVCLFVKQDSYQERCINLKFIQKNRSSAV